jgi:hypothetical protein
LVARIPSDANALVVMNVQGVLQSPLAQKENWREKHENAAAAGLTMVPATANQIMLAAQMDFEFMQPIWEVGMAEVRYEPSMPQVAARWGGEIDRVSNRNAVRLPNDSYVVQFSKNLVGTYRPANRQNISRWLATTDTFDNRLSPYLKSALAYNEKGGTPIIMAMDLTNVISEDLARERLSQLESLKGRNFNTEQLVKAIASIQGITLGVTIKEKIVGAVKVDFAEDVSFLGDAAKPLLLEVLTRQSAKIDEFDEWTAKVEGKRIQITGNLYRSGLQRILSVVAMPESLQGQAAGSSSSDITEEQMQRTASQLYFKAISGFIDDVKDRPDVKSLGQIGNWINRYADKIDKLSIVHVDPALTDYGRYVASAFRDAAEALRGIGGKSRVRSLEVPSSYNFYGRWGTNGAYGGYVQDVKGLQQERTRIRTEERIGAATDARGIMQEVKNVTAEVRVQMTQKYKVDF